MTAWQKNNKILRNYPGLSGGLVHGDPVYNPGLVRGGLTGALNRAVSGYTGLSMANPCSSGTICVLSGNPGSSVTLAGLLRG